MSGFFVGVRTAISTAVTNLSNQIYASFSASSGAGQVGYLPTMTGAQTKTIKDDLNTAPSINLARFLTAAELSDIAAGTKNFNIKPKLDLAISCAAAIGGFVDLPAGQIRLDAEVRLSSGVGLRGQGQLIAMSATREGVTSLWANHAGNSVLSLVGAIACSVCDLSIEAGASAIPKTGLMLGRNSTASAGYHKLQRIAVYGHYSKAPIYTIASEDNYWCDINVWLFGGGAKYCFYTGISDALGTGAGLTASSNLDNTIYRPFFVNSSTDVDSACIFIQAAQAVGSWSFIGGYLTAYAGSYIQIDSGTIDALDALGPFNFVGVSGEILAGGDPIYGVRLTSTGTRKLSGLNISGARFAQLAGTSHYQFYQAGNLILESPNVQIQPPEAFPYALCQVLRAQVKNGRVQVGRYSEWASVTFSGNFANKYIANYEQAAYSMDAEGVVRFRGTVTGTTGNICTLPTEYRPSNNMFFNVWTATGAGRVLITASTGVVSVSSGSQSEIDLSSIVYRI